MPLDITHCIGVHSELKAAMYFISEGWGVYWPLMTQSRCDFIIERNGTFERVQVKTASWSTTHPYKYLQSRCHPKKLGKHYDDNDFDIMVFVKEDRLWVVRWSEISHMTSVCLDGTHPDYKNQKDYDPNLWLVN